MSTTGKLIEKLRDGRITGDELASLLGKLGWAIKRQKGSHQTWSNGSEILVLVAGRKNLKKYQLKNAQDALLQEK